MKNFIDTHGLFDAQAAAPYVVPPTAPSNLATVLAATGGHRYANGFWSFGSSEVLMQHLQPWGLAGDACLPFLRSAFGHVVFLQANACKALNPVFNEVDTLGSASDLDFVLDVLLCDRPSLEASFLIDLYEAAFPRLGPPADDQVYALVPALGLGGSRDPANVQLRPLASEMQILSQL